MNSKRKISIFILVSILFLTFSIISKEVQAEEIVKVGDYIQFGSYYDEPILWRVINIDEDGDPMLLSERILCLKAFDAAGDYHTDDDRRKLGSNEWENSNIRQWLNSSEREINWIQNPPSAENVWKGHNPYYQEKGFITKDNFTENERNLIKPVTHKVLLSAIDKDKRDGGSEVHYGYKYPIDDMIQNYGKAYYKNITDKVFLLSVKELKEYVYDRGWEYRAKPTAKAVENSTYKEFYISNSKFLWYRLRSPDAPYSWSGCYVDDAGLADIYSYASNGIGGVRPALYLNLKSAIFKSGEGTLSSPYLIDSKQESAQTNDIKSLTVTIAKFPIIINCIDINNKNSKYPFLTYRNVTYFPMTRKFTCILGLETSCDSTTGLSVRKSEKDKNISLDLDLGADNNLDEEYSVSIPTSDIILNDKLIDNESEEYPMLVFRGITYFPLTWKYVIDEFGWDLNWDSEKGLTINSTEIAEQ